MLISSVFGRAIWLRGQEPGTERNHLGGGTHGVQVRRGVRPGGRWKCVWADVKDEFAAAPGALDLMFRLRAVK